MKNIIFKNILWFYALWLIPILIIWEILFEKWRKKAILSFIQHELINKIEIFVSKRNRTIKYILFNLASIFLVIALSRPCWNQQDIEFKSRGRDVAFILDVSKSMLARDVSPNRLEKAKLCILDCLEVINGDRVALVVFAGLAAVKCPLTVDYAFFRYILNEVGPHSIERGGSLIGDAIRKTIDEVFSTKENRFKDIILFTDGEDHESFPLQAAEEAAKANIRIIVIGLGDPVTGARIPVSRETNKTEFLVYKGQEIWSRQNTELLAAIAKATPDGRYYNIGTGTIDMTDIYSNLIKQAKKTDIEGTKFLTYQEKFQIFLVVALFMLVAELALTERKTV